MEYKVFNFEIPMSAHHQKKVNKMLAKMRRDGVDYEVNYEFKNPFAVA